MNIKNKTQAYIIIYTSLTIAKVHDITEFVIRHFVYLRYAPRHDNGRIL